MPFGPLDPALYRDLVRRALAEDLGWGDVTTNAIVPDEARVTARLVACEACVVAGLDVAAETFRQLDPAVDVRVLCAEGQPCPADGLIATLSGRAAPLLTAERTALNFLQRLCGIATLTRRFVDAAAGRITILDTRQTTPLLRVLEKYAVRAGGGTNHRFALDDGVLIKDNHLLVAGSLGEAIRRVKAADPELPVEVGIHSLDQLAPALESGAPLILLDHFSIADIREAVRRCGGRAKIEVAGGVTLERIDDIAGTGADFVSVGALTQSVRAIDVRFEIIRRA